MIRFEMIKILVSAFLVNLGIVYLSTDFTQPLPKMYKYGSTSLLQS